MKFHARIKRDKTNENGSEKEMGLIYTRSHAIEVLILKEMKETQ